MQENSAMLGSCGGGGSGVATSAAEANGGGDSGGVEERGNRWPSEETVALLKVRSEMDLEFRVTTLRAPLWDEVSRKLGELGYTRSARKCKEKFENLFKYHKRTKDGRSGRPDGKNYKFCEQLERFDNEPSISMPPSDQNQLRVIGKSTIVEPTVEKFDSACYDFIVAQEILSSNFEVTQSTPTTSSSGRDSEGSDLKERKMADYFENFMNVVLEKQESLQKQLLDALDKCEKDRVAREETWRIQHIERVKKEQELLANERAIAAAKDMAFMALLREVSKHGIPLQFPDTLIPKSNYSNEQQVECLTPLAANIDNQNLKNGLDRQDSPEHGIPLQFPDTVIPKSNYTNEQKLETLTPLAENTDNQNLENSLDRQDNPKHRILTQLPDTSIPKSNYTNEQQLETLTPLTVNIDNQNLEKSLDRQDSPFDKDMDKQGNDIGVSWIQSSKSRWPKEEVEALIRIRTMQNGMRGSVWDEVSSAMKKLGYDREPKRCREKWDNIKKYYKRVKESRKRKPGSSKTCPYFHLLDSMYEKKSAKVEDALDWSSTIISPEDILVQLSNSNNQLHGQYLGGDIRNQNVHQNGGDEAHPEDKVNREDYQLIANNPSTVAYP